MHLTVGYLATPTGDDGVALASALAKTFDADVDVVLVVREELPGRPSRAAPSTSSCSSSGRGVDRPGHRRPGRRRVSARRPRAGRRVLRRVADRLRRGEGLRPDRHRRRARRHLRRPRHRLGRRRAAALLADPGRARPARLRRGPSATITAVTAAVPTRAGDDNPLPFAITLASAAGLPIRMLSLVSAENLAEAEQRAETCVRCRSRPREENLVRRRPRTARRARDRVAGRRRHDAGIGAEEAQLGRRRRSGRRLQPVRRAPADLPGFDGRAHPGRRRRPGDRDSAGRLALPTPRDRGLSTPSCRRLTNRLPTKNSTSTTAHDSRLSSSCDRSLSSKNICTRIASIATVGQDRQHREQPHLQLQLGDRGRGSAARSARWRSAGRRTG